MIEVRQTPAFQKWHLGLQDEQARRRIAMRIERLKGGLLGDTKSVGGGVSELRIDHGPGYRLYFTKQEETIVILLCGGDKGTQGRDIAKAKAMVLE